MLCAIMQPIYLPWIGYFDLIDKVDLFVFLDDVVVVKRSWGVRNRIRGRVQEVVLTVPTRSRANRLERRFCNTEINYSFDWAHKHLTTVAHAYSKTPYFSTVFADLEALLSIRYPSIGDLNMRIIRHLAERIGIGTPFLRSSELLETPGRKDERLVAICRAVGATGYLSPQGSAGYIEKQRPGGALAAAGIELWYHNFEHPEYPQRGENFLSHMAIVDLLMNCGYEAALALIRSGRREMIPFTEFRKTLGASDEPLPDICHAD